MARILDELGNLDNDLNGLIAPEAFANTDFTRVQYEEGDDDNGNSEGEIFRPTLALRHETNQSEFDNTRMSFADLVDDDITLGVYNNARAIKSMVEPSIFLESTADQPGIATLNSSSGAVAGGVRRTINGVVEYIWRHGCGPTAAGIVMGYWDRNGFPDLVQGNSNTQTAQVNAMIASDQHYADYSLPLDGNTSTILRDRSQLGGAHASNCLADFMHTSWSSDNLRYGWTYFDMIDDGIRNYTDSVGYSGFNAWNETWGAFTWNDFTYEIDNNRSMVFLVDTNADGSTDHFVPAIGYDSTTRQYACHDTWSGTGVRWFDFAQISSGQSWGIYGATFIEPSLFPHQTNYDLGSLDSTPKHRSTSLRQGTYEDDVYEFDISVTRNINLSLHDITSGDDADLYLYRDSNSNGLLDATDTLIQRPYRGGNADEAINVRAGTGTYFARVNFYSGGSDGRLDYDLDLSATPISQPSNLLPKEMSLGHISLGTILYNDPTRVKTITRSGWVGNADTCDLYSFTTSSRGDGVRLDVSLTGLSQDADIRLVRDFDRDQIVDANEILDSSILGSNSNESFSCYLDNSYSTYDHFIQVYQYSSDTSYDLNMTFQSVLA